jgi:integrase
MSRGHIRQRSLGSYQIVASGGFDSITGRRKQVFRTVRGTRRDAEKALTKLQAAVDDGTINPGGGEHLEAYLRAWLGSVRRTSTRGTPLAPTTSAKYEAAVQRICDLLGSVRLDRLTSPHVERLRDHLLDEGKLGPDAIGEVMGILSQALNKAVAQGLVSRNVAAREFVTRPAKRRPQFRLVDQELGKALLSAVTGTTWDAPVHLVLATTLRREEVLGLRWSDIDLSEGSLSVEQAVTYASGVVHVGPPKTSAGQRTIVIPAPAVAALQRARVEQNKRRLLLGEAWIERDLVVDRGDGDYWAGPSFSTGWRRFAASRGFQGVSLLSLRHGSATLMLAAGIADSVASDLMGHADTRVLRRYQGIVPELKKDAARRMGELFE